MTFKHAISALERLHDMAVFSKEEMDVFSLAHAMISDYQTNPGYFPNADLAALHEER